MYTVSTAVNKDKDGLEYLKNESLVQTQILSYSTLGEEEVKFCWRKVRHSSLFTMQFHCTIYHSVPQLDIAPLKELL